MSLATKLFLCLILVLVVSLPVSASAFAQEESRATVEVTQHDANIWQAKVDFWRDWQAREQLMAKHIAQTWQDFQLGVR